MPPQKRPIDGDRIWSLSINKSHPETPIVLLARAVADGRQIRIRITPQELRWLMEHAPQIEMEFDLCRHCEHVRSQHSGVQGEVVRGVCASCDRFCTKFVG